MNIIGLWSACLYSYPDITENERVYGATMNYLIV